jgi:hypothetical protein
MQKEIIQGIPFWRDKNSSIYSFELDKKNLIHLGSFDQETQSLKLKENWRELYRPKLSEYRDSLKNRERKENKLVVK